MSESFSEYVAKYFGNKFYDDNIGEKLATLHAYICQQEKISKLEEENAELKTKLVHVESEYAKEREVLNFYGDDANWLSIQVGYGNRIMIKPKDMDFLNEEDDDATEVGGKRARQRIKERKEF